MTARIKPNLMKSEIRSIAQFSYYKIAQITRLTRDPREHICSRGGNVRNRICQFVQCALDFQVFRRYLASVLTV